MNRNTRHHFYGDFRNWELDISDVLEIFGFSWGRSDDWYWGNRRSVVINAQTKYGVLTAAEAQAMDEEIQDRSQGLVGFDYQAYLEDESVIFYEL